MDQLWKGEYTARLLTQRFAPKVTGIAYKATPNWLWSMFPAFMGFAIGLFVAIVILRPDLINWETFFRSFMLGIIIGRH
jgi:hypothetical protein